LQAEVLKSKNLAKELEFFKGGFKSVPSTEKAKADKDM